MEGIRSEQLGYVYGRRCTEIEQIRYCVWPVTSQAVLALEIAVWWKLRHSQVVGDALEGITQLQRHRRIEILTTTSE